MRFTVDKVIRCLVMESCAGVETVSMAAAVFLERRYGLRFNGEVCPLCGRTFRSLYNHYVRGGCGVVLRLMLREFVNMYVRCRGLCAKGGGRIVCRVCRRDFNSMRECLVHLFDSHLEVVCSAD